MSFKDAFVKSLILAKTEQNLQKKVDKYKRELEKHPELIPIKARRIPKRIPIKRVVPVRRLAATLHMQVQRQQQRQKQQNIPLQLQTPQRIQQPQSIGFGDVPRPTTQQSRQRIDTIPRPQAISRQKTPPQPLQQAPQMQKQQPTQLQPPTTGMVQEGEMNLEGYEKISFDIKEESPTREVETKIPMQQVAQTKKPLRKLPTPGLSQPQMQRQQPTLKKKIPTTNKPLKISNPDLRASLGELASLLEDPYVRSIEFRKGNLIIISDRKEISHGRLSEDEAKHIVETFAHLSNKQMTPQFQTTYQRLTISAVMSEVLGTRFIIKKV